MAKGVKYNRHPSRRSSTPSNTLIFTILLGCSFLVLILLGLGIVSLPTTTTPTSNSSSKSPSKSSHRARDLNSFVRESVKKYDVNVVSEDRGDQWVELISWEPRAFVYHNFLSGEECDYLIELAKPNMQKSEVVDTATGKGVDSRVRTSSGTFLERGRDEVVRRIEKRIADWTFIPVDHGEGLQVLHYQVGQKYESHYDYFADEFSTRNGGQRIATVLMYLTDVEEGGETVFPHAKGNHSAVPYWDKLSKCGKEGLSVLPTRGDALLFWSMHPDASLDPSSFHGGCPVVKGNKWSSTKWMRVNEFRV